MYIHAIIPYYTRTIPCLMIFSTKKTKNIQPYATHAFWPELKHGEKNMQDFVGWSILVAWAKRLKVTFCRCGLRVTKGPYSSHDLTPGAAGEVPSPSKS